MDIENPTSVIASATNAVSQAISFAAEKLGPMATKVVEVVQRQVIVDAVTLLIALVITGIICYFSTKLAYQFDAKITPTSHQNDDSRNGMISFAFTIVAVLSVVLMGFLLWQTVATVPTAFCNPEYATAKKFMEIFKEMK